MKQRVKPRRVVEILKRLHEYPDPDSFRVTPREWEAYHDELGLTKQETQWMVQALGERGFGSAGRLRPEPYQGYDPVIGTIQFHAWRSLMGFVVSAKGDPDSSRLDFEARYHGRQEQYYAASAMMDAECGDRVLQGFGTPVPAYFIEAQTPMFPRGHLTTPTHVSLLMRE